MENKLNFFRLAVKTTLITAFIALFVIPIIGDGFGKLTLYNRLFPGRERFPYSDDPRQSFSLSLFNLDANFASHLLSAPGEHTDEYRIVMLGDSSTWGTLLTPHKTLTGQLNSLNLSTADGTPIRFYNLGYPTLDLSKDLMVLDTALDYAPDMIVWLVTLESFPTNKQFSSPIVVHNADRILDIIENYQLQLNENDTTLRCRTYWDSTLIGQRRDLADLLRLQLYGVMWGITGIDQYYPTDYTRAARDLSADASFHGWENGEMGSEDLAFTFIEAGIDMAGNRPLLLINEPILISSGMNSDLRYDFYYPIWAYDQYRQQLGDFCRNKTLSCLDLWDAVPEDEFTNTAIHLTPEGVGLLTNPVAEAILDLIPPDFEKE
jgi:hypothetical protein